MSNYLDTPPELRLDPISATPSVALVHPHMLEARKLIVSALQQQRHGCAILNIRGVHLCTKYETTRIDEDVAFAPIDALGAIVASDTADACRSNRLAVDDASTRLGMAPDPHAELLA